MRPRPGASAFLVGHKVRLRALGDCHRITGVRGELLSREERKGRKTRGRTATSLMTSGVGAEIYMADQQQLTHVNRGEIRLPAEQMSPMGEAPEAIAEPIHVLVSVPSRGGFVGSGPVE